jgi:hypothetical protein
MASLQYQVLVVHQGRNYFAHLFDLKCEAIGVSVDEAIARIGSQAAEILSEYGDEALDLPTPSDLTIASVRLPRPVTKRRLGHDAPFVPDDLKAG